MSNSSNDTGSRTIDLNPTIRQILYLLAAIGGIVASLAVAFGWLTSEEVAGVLAALAALHALAAGKTDTTKPPSAPSDPEPAPAEPVEPTTEA